MKHKIFRALLSLVLVCVLLISWSPIRARATSAGATAGIITQVLPLAGEGGAVAGGATLGTAVFGYVLAGLGIAVTGAALLTLVDRYKEYSGDMDVVMYYYSDGTWSYGVDVSFIEKVHDFIFNTDLCNTLDKWIPSQELQKLDNYMDLFADTYGTRPYVYWFKHPGSNVTVAIALAQTVPIVINGVARPTNGSYMWNVSYNGVTIVKSDGVISQFNPYGNKFFVFRGRVSDGAAIQFDEIGELALPGSLGNESAWAESVYAGWYDNSRAVTNAETEEKKILLPIPLKPDEDALDQVDAVTQGDVWIGSIADAPSGTVPDVVPDTIGLSDIWSMIKSIPGALADVITGPIVGTLTDIWNFIKTIPGSLADVITGPIVGALTNIWDLITSIPQAIAEAISAIFIPSEDFLSAKWEAIRSEFTFADSIITSGQSILDIFRGVDPEPPVIYINLGDSESSYNLGGQVAFLDLRWYERYKSTGDAIISAFLWLAFAWRMFLKLPGIISGLPGDFVMHSVVDLGLSDHLPSRKKEYEYQRQENRRFIKK